MVTDHSIVNGPSLTAFKSRPDASSKLIRKNTALGGSWHLGVKLAFRPGINRLRVRSALHGGERLFVGIEDVYDNDQLDRRPLAGIPDVTIDVQIVLIAMRSRFEDLDYGRLWLRPSLRKKREQLLRREAGAAIRIHTPGYNRIQCRLVSPDLCV